MLSSSIPVKFQLTWGQNAPGSAIRVPPFPSQQSIQAGAASFNDGFPSPACFLPTTAGGTPPFGVDFNGALNLFSAWLQWTQAGGGVPIYDVTFSGQITGYPSGALLLSSTTPGQFYQSQADNNQTNPDNAGARQNWYVSGVITGDVKWRPTAETLAGWAKADTTTIGDGSSGAVQLASPDAKLLFIWLWTNFSNTQCPVSGGRGASALADFNAHKTIQTLDMRGYGIMGADVGGTTRLNGVPISSGNTTTPGSLLGENLHSLVAAENGPHVHGITDPGHTHQMGAIAIASGGQTSAQSGNSPQTMSTNTTGITINSQGSGSGHNTVQLSLIGTWYLKL